jgi:hypothetical protein
MPTFRGNRGNLLQHWVLAELVSIVADNYRQNIRLLFIDAHALSPYAVRSPSQSQTAADFDFVANHLPGQGSAYEQAWRHLREGRCQYPTSASLVRNLWSRPLDLVLCEVDESTADEIAEWERTLVDTQMELHRGDWRERFRKGFTADADLYLISFDPYMFDRHGAPGSPNRANMWPNDILRAAAAIPSKPVIVQLSTYSANNANAQNDVVSSIEPVFTEIGLELAATVRSDGNMMSMVFSRDVSQIRDAKLEQRFAAWLSQATAADRMSAGPVAAKKLDGPVPNEGLSSAMAARITEYVGGNTKTTQVGYINRNRQKCTGHRGVAGTDHGQQAYRMECLETNCGHVYGANGTDVFQRKCPRCGGGKPGITF